MLKVFVLLLSMVKISYPFRYMIILRHGESLWNKNELYTGWADVPLTKLGMKEAKNAAKLIKQYGVLPTISYSSELERCVDSASIIVKELNLEKVILQSKNWRLNERHYGKLTGYNRNNIKWKGEYFDLPPNDLDSLNNYKIYNEITYVPEYGESHYMTSLRVEPIYKIFEHMVKVKHVPMVITHKNTARALMKHIEKFKEEDINNIEVPNATPIIYKFDEQMKLLDKIILYDDDLPQYSFD